jgi:hypothetical protein
VVYMDGVAPIWRVRLEVCINTEEKTCTSSVGVLPLLGGITKVC